METNKYCLDVDDLKQLYDSIVVLGESEYIIENKRSIFVDKNSVVTAILGNDLNKDKFIVNKNKNYIVTSVNFGYDTRKFDVHENFILSKNLDNTLSLEVYRVISSGKYTHAIVLIYTNENTINQLLFSNKHIKDIDKKIVIKAISSDLLLFAKNNYEKDVKLKTSFLNTVVIGTSDKLEENEIIKNSNELYLYKKENINGIFTIKIKDDIVEEFNSCNPKEDNLIVNISKIIRLTAEEFSNLNNEDKQIYDNIEKHLQLYVKNGIKFDSVAATIRYLEQTINKVKNKKVNRIAKKIASSLNTFRLHYIIVDSDYKRSKQCEHYREGHYRHYKNGKVIYIDSYKAGNNKK